MKRQLDRLKFAALAALTMGLALGARAENVAEVTIDGTTTGYDTLGEAWSACNGKDATLKLLANVDITSALDKSWMDNSLSFDLNGHTLKQTGNDRIISMNGKLTVENGILTRSGTSYSDSGAGILVKHNGASYENTLSRLVMRDVTMTNCVTTKDGGAIYAERDTQMLLENCTLQQNVAGGSGGAIYTFGGQTENQANESDIKAPWDKLVLVSTVITDNMAGTSGAGVYYKYTEPGSSCFVAGTLVRMADGNDKKIEEVEEGDIVRTFDHEGGTNSTARVYYAFKSEGKATPFTLEFEGDGGGRGATALTIVGCHDLLLKDTRKYVTITRQNVGQYIGAKFYGEDGAWHTLTNVTMGTEAVAYYSIYSAQHQNVYANGMLTVCDDVDYLLNIYKLDETLKADAQQLAADFVEYGTFSYEEAATYGVSQEWYDAVGVKYMYIAMGKQLVSREYAEQLFTSTGRAASPLAAVALGGGRAATALPKLTTESNESDPLADYPSSLLTLGAGTIVTNNLVGTTPNNIYLEKQEAGFSLIALANDRTGICVGVTPQWTTGQITAYHYANPGDIALFRSDNADYAVWYELGDQGSFLKLAAGSQIMPPAVANTTYEIWAGGECVAQNEGTSVIINTEVKVVYTADDGYVFDGSGLTTKEVGVDTSQSIATMTPPDAPFEPVARVTTNGVSTDYATLASAWEEACEIQKTGTDVTVMLLKDTTVESTLATGSNGALTLNLNDHVLAYAGTDESIILQNVGTLHVVDTATTRTPHYFTCDATTGLWTITNEVTDLVVKGGLLIGGRNSAIYYTSGAHSISNVNFVGNSSTYNGGAVTTFNTIIQLTITDCAFLGNVAEKSGGAVSSGNVTMTDCQVEANVATENGGGLSIRDHGSLVRTKVVGNKAEKAGGGVHVEYNPGGCFPAGVKIRMADGSEKAVEEVAKGDVVATFDHEGGVKSSATVFYVYQGSMAQNVFTLSFASGAKLDIADRHDLLLEATRKYATVSFDNARSYIGSRFYNYATGAWDVLTGVSPAKGGNAYYSLYTSGHINCVANGMLTVSDDKDFYLNVYALDENLKADAAQLAADIAAYGLATNEDYPNIPLEDFSDSNMRYARIAIGKGLVAQKDILFWNEFDYGPAVAKKAKGALTFGTSSVEAVAPSADYLQVGEGTVITGNVNATVTDNVYLLSTEAFGTTYDPVIDVLPNTTDLDIGVTLSTHVGVFGWTNDVNYARKFTSDNPDYVVAYTADKTLALRAGVQVGDDAWALIGDGICTVYGTGDMWAYDKAGASPLWDSRSAITNLVIDSGVTSVGTRFFENMWWLKDVSLGASVTNVGDRAFKKCYGLTNVVSRKEGDSRIGNYAFAGCHSLQALDFGEDGKPEFGEEAYAFKAAIYMRDGIPDVYTVPELTMGNYDAVKLGSNDLKTWVEIDDTSKKNFHFFKITLNPKK